MIRVTVTFKMYGTQLILETQKRKNAMDFFNRYKNDKHVKDIKTETFFKNNKERG